MRRFLPFVCAFLGAAALTVAATAEADAAIRTLPGNGCQSMGSRFICPMVSDTALPGKDVTKVYVDFWVDGVGGGGAPNSPPPDANITFALCRKPFFFDNDALLQCGGVARGVPALFAHGKAYDVAVDANADGTTPIGGGDWDYYFAVIDSSRFIKLTGIGWRKP